MAGATRAIALGGAAALALAGCFGDGCGGGPAQRGESCAEVACADGLACDGCSTVCVRPDDPPGATYAYVADALRLPDPGETLGCDLDGNGSVDNALGVLATQLSTLGIPFDPQAAIDAALAAGDPVWLLRLEEVADFDADGIVRATSLLGADADADPSNNYGGQGVFTATSADPAFPATVCAGALSAGPGTARLALPLVSGTLTTVPMTAVSITARADALGLADGVFCGAVTGETLDTVLFPAVLEGLNLLVAAYTTGDPAVACTSDGTTIGNGASATCSALDPSSVCTASNGVDTGYCVDGSQPVVQFLLAASIDADGNGLVAGDEFDQYLPLLFAPDLDLDGSGEAESMSFGMAFTAVRATIK
jgi:hypothetical protein